MMRFLVVLLIFHFSVLSLVSCTTQDTGDSPAEDLSISESDLDDINDTGGDAGIEDQAANNDSAGEDELENELDSQDDQEVSLQDESDKPDATAQAEQQTDPMDEDSLENELAEEDVKPQPDSPQETPAPPVVAEQPPPPPPEPLEPAAPELAKVRDIRYLSNASGGTVVIETSKPVQYQTRMNSATQQYVIEMAEVELPASLQRPFKMSGMGSQIGSINAYQGAGSNTARVVIQLSGRGGGEPVVQQEGTSLVVIPPAPVVVAETPKPTTVPSAPQGPPQGPLAARTLDEFLTGNQRFYGKAMSLQVKDADVRDVINLIAEDSGSNLVISDDVSGKISLKLRKIPWDQALVTVMRAKQLGYTRQGNVLRISTLASLQTETETANKILEAQKAIVPAVVHVIPVSYANIDDLVKSVTVFMSKTGSVIGDNRTNTLIVTDRLEVVERIDKLVRTLDIIPPQVSIESKIVEAVEGFESFVGLNWSIQGSPVNISPGGGVGGAPITITPNAQSATLSSEFSRATPLSAGFTVGVLDGLGNLSATLQLAERNSLAKVISAPRISTMNREESVITQSGEAVAIVTTRNEQTNTTTKTPLRSPFSLNLKVKPQITTDGSVIMDLDVKREFLGPPEDAETQARAVNSRSAKTKVLVRNGQTAVIGGIYSSDETEAVNGIPVLKDIPVLGWLFKNKSVSRTKNELLIFMTPRILTADGSGTEGSAPPAPPTITQ